MKVPAVTLFTFKLPFVKVAVPSVNKFASTVLAVNLPFVVNEPAVTIPVNVALSPV